MADSMYRDANNIPLLGAQSTLGRSTVELYANPTTHALLVESTSGATDQDVNIVAVGGNSVTTTVPTSTLPLSTVGNGGKAIAVTGTAVALTSTSSISGIIITASSTNEESIFVGKSTVTKDYGLATSGLELQPGQSIGISINDPSKVYINGTALDSVSFLTLA